ncbi:hypothetical protein SAMN04488581_2621 [Mycolicibacterium neoaurum]|nr:hypothetical protein SAMN04488581_2621 [Mycolicibacterium neoaurum]
MTDQNTHRCASGKTCKASIVDDDGKRQAKETERPDDLCPACLNHTTHRIQELPEQWLRLHAMIGERHTGVDVNIRRPKPSGTVPLNLHVDTLLGGIVTELTTAAEVIADKTNMDNPAHTNPAKQVQACAHIVAPHITTLIHATGVGGRDPDDKAIDVLTWAPNGLIHMPSTTTGLQIVKRLDHYGALAHYTLGMTRARTHRDLPCTRCRARTVGRWAGSDWFDCTTCGSQFPEDELRRQDKILLELHKRGMEVTL